MIKHIFRSTLYLILPSIFVHQATADVMGLPTVADYSERAEQHAVVLTVPHFPQTAEEIASIEAELEHDIQIMGDTIANLTLDELNFENTFRAIDLGQARLYKKILPINIVKNTHSNPEVRKAASTAMLHFSKLGIGFEYREDVYLNLKAYADSDPQLSAEDQRLVDHDLLKYKRLGFDLAIEDRSKVEALNKTMSELSTEFRDNIRESNESLFFTADELTGLNPSFMESIMTEEGTFEIKPNVTHHVLNVYQQVNSEATRKRVYTARSSRAMEKNLDVISKMVKTRYELAKTLGYNTWADFKTEDRMAGSGDRAVEFLEDLTANLKPKLQSELADLVAIKREETGDPDAVLNIWDVTHYQEKQNKLLYDLDTEALKQYFPYERCIDGLFEVYETVFNIEIREISNPEPWDPNVFLYAVSDVETEKPLGLFYIDPFPREGKYNHFAQFGIIPGVELQDGWYQRPTIALICNFSPPTDNEPSLLTFDQVETLFHEFGHGMHSILTEAKFSSFSGTSVPRDFVETPSQTMEYWLKQKEILDLFAADWRDQMKTLPDSVVDKINASTIAQAGWHYSRQMSFALIDMKLHHLAELGTVADNIAEVTNTIAADTILPFPDDTAFVAAFGHLAGYDAGYYGYAWADVIAADVANQFYSAEDGFMDPEMGMKLRREIFEPGNSRDPNESVRAFLGRDANNDAFIKSLGL